MPRNAESQLTRQALSSVEKIPRSWFRKRRATAGLQGHPDITGVIEGVRVELEAKVPGGKVSQKQKYILAKYEACGAITGVFVTVEEFQRLIFDGLQKKGIHVNRNYFTQLRGLEQ